MGNGLKLHQWRFRLILRKALSQKDCQALKQASQGSCVPGVLKRYVVVMLRDIFYWWP